LPQNLLVKMTSIHAPSTYQYKPINCTNESSFIFKKKTITQHLFLVILDVCIIQRWSLWGVSCENPLCINNKNPLVVIDGFFCIFIIILTIIWTSLWFHEVFILTGHC